jgi:hypothetical protein
MLSDELLVLFFSLSGPDSTQTMPQTPTLL